VTGAHYRFSANAANTGACTINFNSLGAITIKKAVGGITTDLVANDIRTGQWVDLVYDGTNMQMQSTSGNGSGGSVNSGTSTNVAYYAATGTAVSSSSVITIGASGQAAITTGTNQNITLTPTGTGRVTVTNAGTGQATLLEMVGSAADYTQVNVGRDSTHYGTFEWDNVAQDFDLSTYSLTYPVKLRGTYLIFNSSASDLERARVSNTGNLLVGTTSDTGLTGAGGLKVGSTTTSSSATTGALVVAGAIGVGSGIHNGGDLVFTSAAANHTIWMQSGAGAMCGTFTLSSGSATVTNGAVTAGSIVICSIKTASGTPGTATPSITVTASTGFTVTGLSTDNSTYNFMIFNVQ